MKPRILIVEDEAIIAEDLKEILCDAGFDVVAIADSETAAIAASANPPDAAVVDIRLRQDSQSDGRLAGIRLAEELWVCQRVPVVFVTAFPELVTRECASNSGVFGLVSKPFSPAAVIGQLNIALEKVKDFLSRSAATDTPAPGSRRGTGSKRAKSAARGSKR